MRGARSLFVFSKVPPPLSLPSLQFPIYSLEDDDDDDGDDDNDHRLIISILQMFKVSKCIFCHR